MAAGELHTGRAPRQEGGKWACSQQSFPLCFPFPTTPVQSGVPGGGGGGITSGVGLIEFGMYLEHSAVGSHCAVAPQQGAEGAHMCSS